MAILLALLLSVSGATAWLEQTAEDDAYRPGLYWTQHGSNLIYRANLDGSDIEAILHVPGEQYRGPMPSSILIDRAAGEMFFWAKEPDSWQVYRLWRAGLDGSHLRQAFPNLHQFVQVWDTSVALGLDVQNHDLYWSSSQPYQPDNYSSFVRGNLDDGSMGLRFMPGPKDPLGFPEKQPDLEVIQPAGLFYWSAMDGIRRASLDGIEAEVVLFNNSPTLAPMENTPFALDAGANTIYFVTVKPNGNGEDALARVQVDTQQKALLAAEPARNRIMDVAVDTVHGKLYWSVAGQEAVIRRANLDGTDLETVIDELQGPLGLALDPAAGNLYWADWLAQKIQRANLDGSDVEDLVDTAPMRPRFLALDSVKGRIFWTGQGNGRVWHARLDGDEPGLLVSGAASKTGGIDTNLAADTLYWIDTASQSVTMARSDGSEVRDVLYPRVSGARGFFIEPTLRQIVWYDGGAQAIKRANLDGSGTETIISGDFGEVTSLAWDPLRQTMCWADSTLRHIECAGWNGKGRHIILDETDGLRRPNFLAIDPRAGHVYWTDWSTQSLYRAKLDGSKILTIVSGELETPSGLALNLETLDIRRSYLPHVTSPSGE